jgi:polyhydroxyalkanoate synthesis regulator phasin
MGLFGNLIKALDRIPLWKHLQEVPSELDDLKRRVSGEIRSELDALSRRVSEEIPSELDALSRRVSEEIPSELDALKRRVSEEIPFEFDEFKRHVTEEILSKLDALKRRVSELEEKLGDKWPADVCRHCGERGLRLAHAIPVPDSQGYMREDWRCERCGKYDVKAYKPGNR